MATASSRRDGARRGFTLLEVEIAVLVLTLTVLGLYKLVHNHQQLVSSMQDWLKAPEQYVHPPAAPFEDLVGVPATLTADSQPPVVVTDTRGKLAYTVTIEEIERTLDPPAAIATVVVERIP